MNYNGDVVKQKAAIEFANALERNFPPEVSVGVGVVLPNLVNGCSWGFVNDSNKDYVKYLEAIASNKSMSSFKIKGGYLYSIDMTYLLNVLHKVAGGLVTKEDLEIASEHRQEALAKLEKFMKDGKSGKIGIYNLNDSPKITVKGVTYPAFCVTLNDLLVLSVKHGYYFKLGGRLRSPGDVRARALKVVENLELAPSRNALFIEIEKVSRSYTVPSSRV